MTPQRISDAFIAQADHCANLGSDFTARLYTLFATRDWPTDQVRDRIFDWPRDSSNRADAVPLRLAGALHAMRLDGDAALVASYPPHNVSDDTLWTAVTKQ